MNAVQLSMTAGGVVTAWAAIYRFVLRPVFRWARKLETAVDFVHEQMVNNGGSSMRDAIDRIERRLGEVEELVTKPFR